MSQAQVVTGSAVFGNAWRGIVLLDSAQGRIIDCTISGNKYDGIWLRDSAQIVIINSTISENEGSGILLWNSAQAEITGNLIRGNRRAGIKSWSTGRVVGNNNTIEHNGVDLVDLLGNLPADLRIPLVKATRQEIRLPDARYPTLQHAVDALLPGGRLVLGEGTYTGGVTVDKDITIEARIGTKPRIDGGYAVISLVGPFQVRLIGITLSGAEEYGLVGGAPTLVEITNCTILENRFGIVLGNRVGNQVKIDSCNIARNKWYGVWIWGSAQSLISNSTVSENGKEGIVVRGSARMQITNVIVSENRGKGIHLGASVQVKIAGSTISGNGDAGIDVEKSAQLKPIFYS